jgi:DNA-binding NarL/FixJ family response regulator
MHTLEPEGTVPEADDAPMHFGDKHYFGVFIVSKGKMVREAFCNAFRNLEPAIAFFPVTSIADIASPAAMPHAILALIYSDGESSSCEWVREELALASGAGMRVAIISEATTSLPEVIELMQLGCRGFISSNFSFQVALSAVKIIAEGEPFVPADIIQDAAQEELSKMQLLSIPREHIEQGRGWAALSWRERTVLELACRGMPNRNIGNELGIATSTVKIHVSKIMKKLQVTNRTQLCALLAKARAGSGS